jgi:hypothetical protein
MNPILPDTDLLIDYLRGHEKAVAFLKARMDRIVLSVVVIAELYSGIRKPDEKEAIDALIEVCPTFPVGLELAKQAGRYKREYQKSHGIGLTDALIAATATAGNAELKTLNVKHYPMFKGLKPPYKKT